MAVAYDATSESHTGTTGSVSQASFTWNHTPVGTPRGVLIYVINSGPTSADNVTSVTYGGTAVPAVTGGAAVDTATEPGRAAAYFLGSGIPTGVQAVVVNRTNNTDVLYAVMATVTAAADTEVTGIVLQQENQTPVEANVTDGSPGTNSVRFGGAHNGGSANPVAGANSTNINGIQFAARGAGMVRETVAGQGSRPVGFSTGAADDWAAVLLAVREAVAATPLVIRRRIITGQSLRRAALR